GIRGDPIIALGKPEEDSGGRERNGAQLKRNMSRSKQTADDGTQAVQCLAPYPAVFPAFELEHRPQQKSDVFTELDVRGIERVVTGTLQCDGAQHAVVLGQRDRTDGVLAMLT